MKQLAFLGTAFYLGFLANQTPASAQKNLASAINECPIGRTCLHWERDRAIECPAGTVVLDVIPIGDGSQERILQCGHELQNSEEINPPNPNRFDPAHLADVAKQATKKHANNCSGSVREAAKMLGIKLLGQQANNQVDYMAKNWRQVSMEEAKQLADQGVFVVVGRKHYPHGHVAIVVPGSGLLSPDPVTGQKRLWPNVAGGALGRGGRIGRSYSEGNKTVRQVWPKSMLSGVRFYTPQ
jgi:hypothetical protein